MKTQQTLSQNSAVRRGKVFRVVCYAILVLWALIVLFPFYYMVLTALKSTTEYDNELTPKLYTLRPTIDNFLTAFSAAPLARYFLNTVIFMIGTTAIMLFVTILAAFAFARLDFKGKNLAFTLVLALMMLPSELVVITNYVTITNWDMRNTFLGLILPSVASVFYIYLLKETFAQVPDELYYAAKVDGTSDLKYLFKVMVPICSPSVVTVALLKAIECWNSYVWPRLVADEEAYYLVSNGLQEIREHGYGRDNIPGAMAAAVVISLPLIVLFVIFRRKIMEGVARGGVKG